MSTTIAVIGGRASAAADWSQSLDANAGVAYLSNPTLIAGPHQSDETAQLTVDGNASAQTEVSQLTITPRLSSTRYDHETDLDITTGSIDLAYLRRFERSQWTFDGQALTDSTLTSELGTSGVTSVNLRRYLNSLSTGYRYQATERLAWQLQGSWQDTRYTQAAALGLYNYTYTSVQSGPTWNLSERLQGSVILETDRINPQTGTTQNSYSASLQLGRNVTEQYFWQASAGATRLEQQGSSGSGTSWVAQVSASHGGERVQWNLSVKRTVAPIGFGLLALQNAATAALTVSTSERSTLNFSLSAIHSDPVTEFIYLAPGFGLSYQVYSGAAWGKADADWQYHLSQKWSLSAAYAYQRARNYSQPEWANGNQVRLGVLWQSGRL